MLYNHFTFVKCMMHKFFVSTVKPLNSRHLRVLKNLSIVKRCPLLGGSLIEITTFGTKHLVRCSRHDRYLEYPLLRGSTVFIFIFFIFRDRLKAEFETITETNERTKVGYVSFCRSHFFPLDYILFNIRWNNCHSACVQEMGS